MNWLAPLAACALRAHDLRCSLFATSRSFQSHLASLAPFRCASTKRAVGHDTHSGSDAKPACVLAARFGQSYARGAGSVVKRRAHAFRALRALVKTLHEQLLERGRSDGTDPLPGEFRPGFAVIEESNSRGFGNRVRFIPPKPDMVSRLMADLEQFIQTGNTWPTLIEIAVAHYQFETIHPFKDGNGRVGRLLAVLMLIADGLLHYPLLYLSSYIEQHRTEYADRLLAVSEDGDWDAWLQFFLRGIREQAAEAFVRAKLLIDTRRTYETRYADTAKSVRSLALGIFEDPYFTVKEASDRIGVVYQTANNAVKQLESDGVVSEITGNSKNRVFRADEIMNIVEQPARELPDANELVDIEHAWKLPDR